VSFAEIEAALPNLSPDELKRLALKSWTVFLEREGTGEAAHECSEDDPELLAALDHAIAEADRNPGTGHSANEVRQSLRRWTSR
jgi:hypothetical protein